MFDLIVGNASHIPSKPAVPVLVSIATQAGLVAALLVPLLLVTGQLPEVPSMMAFVAAPPAPPPPPPAPPPAAPAPQPTPKAPAQPVASPEAAPVAAPSSIAPERAVDAGEVGVPGGVEGGVPGGVLGGVVGGLVTEIPPPPPPPPAEPRAPVRVGGQIQAPTLVRRVEPVYPTLAVHANIRGTVILEAVVDADGRVASVKVLRSAHRILDEAAADAVRQWQYSPVILNGIPERFVLTVVLSFNLTETS